MKSFFSFAIAFAFVVLSVLASPGPNAIRLAKGLPPLPPKSLAPSRARSARRSTTSNAPGNGGGQCNTGPVQCCNTVSRASENQHANLLAELLDIVLDPSVLVGTSCSPITGAGLGSGSQCSQQPVCCENNSYNGLIVIGCSPINIYL